MCLQSIKQIPIKRSLIAAIYLLTTFGSFAQVGVEGVWEGTITLERPAPMKEYKFELVIRKKGKEIKGTSYIYYKEGDAVSMDLSGYYFSDRSMRLFNYDVLYPANALNKEQHIRKYQLMYKRSAFNPDTIEGYWQEKNDPIFAKYRKGKVYLTKKRGLSKA